MIWEDKEDLRLLRENFDKNFQLGSLNLNLNRRWKLLQERVEKTLKFDEAELIARYKKVMGK